MSDEPRIVSIDITHLVHAALAIADTDGASPTAEPSPCGQAPTDR
jgi:hypothetical protein